MTKSYLLGVKSVFKSNELYGTKAIGYKVSNAIQLNVLNFYQKERILTYKPSIRYTLHGAHPLGLIKGVHLLGNPAHLIEERICVDLSADTMHLKDSLVLFGFEGSSCSLPLFFFHLELISFVIVLQQ